MAIAGDIGRAEPGHGPAEAAASRDRIVGVEAGKTIARKTAEGFVARYLSGTAILDIGYRGYIEDAVPVVPQAVGIELDYPGYDGRTLPFADLSQDAVFASHCLEHIADYRNALREWHRVLKIGGFLVVAVPHQFLYERRTGLPSRWNQDHKRFYTPASLMAEVEQSLAPNTYRLRHLIDNDLDYDYAVPLSAHPGGCYEIELVLERIRPPAWQLEDPPAEPEHAAPAAEGTPGFRPRRSQRMVLALWGAMPRPVRRLLPQSLRSAGAAALWR